MKTMGVLGGLGPQATIDFVQRVHRVSQERIPPFWGSGYPPMVVVFFREPPILLGEDGSPTEPHQPNPALLETAAKLGAWADFLVVTANAPHLFALEIEAAAGRPILNMIEVTLRELKRRESALVGLMGLGRPRVYEQAMAMADLPYVTLPEAERGRLDGMIRAVMEGRNDDEGTRVALAAVDRLRYLGATDIVLGCTEIPLLLGEHQNATNLVNPTQLLAEAAVAYTLDE